MAKEFIKGGRDSGADVNTQPETSEYESNPEETKAMIRANEDVVIK